MSRSQSRGREALISSGRGGAGNIRPASRDPVARVKGPDDLSPTRGRELPVIGDHFTHTGIGGSGNVRTPSRDTVGERKYVAGVEKYAREHHDPNAPISHGRGGYGNVTRSPAASRSPTRTSQETNHAPAPVHTFGHGGAGNVTAGGISKDGLLTLLDQQEARAHHHQSQV